MLVTERGRERAARQRVDWFKVASWLAALVFSLACWAVVIRVVL